MNRGRNQGRSYTTLNTVTTDVKTSCRSSKKSPKKERSERSNIYELSRSHFSFEGQLRLSPFLELELLEERREFTNTDSGILFVEV